MKKAFRIFLYILICINLISCTAIKKIHEDPVIPNNIFDDIIEKNVELESLKPNFGGKVFCDYMVIDSEKDDDTIKIYLDLYSQEYYLKNNELTKGTGAIFLAVLTVKVENGEYLFLSCNISREEETKESIKNFPKKVQKKFLKAGGKFNGQSTKKNEDRALEYFKLDN